MGLSYNKLWKMLVDKKMSKADLRKLIDISPNTMTKLRREEPVNMNILLKICDEFHCGINEIIDYFPEEVSKNLPVMNGKRLNDEELGLLSAAGDFCENKID